MKLKVRRIFTAILALTGVLVWIFTNPNSYETEYQKTDDKDIQPSSSQKAVLTGQTEDSGLQASKLLELLDVKGRAPKEGYERDEFYPGWPTVDGCNLRQIIIKREFGDSAVLDGCNVISGEYDEPYTGEHLAFTSKEQISKKIQIDHVVALSDAWQKGAKYFDYDTRNKIATDPLNLLAVDASANKQKSDGDAATWLPKNKKFRCQYIARQISVKYKYQLWVTEAEKNAMINVLKECPNEMAVGV